MYQQHHRHLINKLKDDSCSHVCFWNDLLRQMKKWRTDGERLILCLDANENIYWGELGRIPFSSEALLWIRQCQVYQSLLRWHDGKLRNYGILRRMARRCQINAPFQLSIDNIKLHLTICKERCNYFQKHGQCHRQQHLTDCLEAAQDREDAAAERKILAIIKREKDRASWHRLNYVLGKHVHGQSVRAVQVEDGAGGGAGLRHRRGCAGCNFH